MKTKPYNSIDYIKNDEEVAKIILHKATSFDLFEEVLEKAKTINLAKIEVLNE